MIWLLALLALGLSEACASRPTRIPSSQILKDLPKCLHNNHSIALTSHENYHIVEKGETLYRISQNYVVPLEELARINGIEDVTQIEIGDMLIIPGARTTNFIWPLRGKISSPFGRRGTWHFHSGIDIPAPKGTSIRAAADGLVVLSGKGLDGYGDYGKIVAIEHGNGIRTMYAHNRENHVRAGECVRAGEVIGEVGSSGNANGSHLHFEIRMNGTPVDPLKYLP